MTPLRILCPPTAFRCDNGPCIALALRCNGRIDCPYDSSDELDCGPISNEIDRKKLKNLKKNQENPKNPKEKAPITDSPRSEM